MGKQTLCLYNYRAGECFRGPRTIGSLCPEESTPPKRPAETKTFPISTDRSANRDAQWEESFSYVSCQEQKRSEVIGKRIISVEPGSLEKYNNRNDELIVESAAGF